MNTDIKKKVYFIRHGQSDGNVDRTFQDFADPLTEVGVEQAKLVAKRALTLKAEIILSSPMERAFNTAEEIQKETGLKLEKVEELREASVPTFLIGKRTDSDESNAYLKEFFTNIDNPEWRYDDEENYTDLFKRSKTVLDKIISREESTLIVVTHGAILSIIMATMINEGVVDGRIATKIFRFLRHSNTGITLCEYNSGIGKANPWGLHAWNDQVHLEELEI